MREPRLMAVCGRKGVGKSFITMKYIREYVSVSPRRKFLIFDVNNEYSDKTKFPFIKTISLANVPALSMSNYPEICRIGPFFDDGTPMSLDEMARVLQWIVRNYKNGGLLIEDINLYVSDNMPGDLIGAICTNRHSGLDIILHYQSLGRLSPKVWQNINVLRMHQQTDALDRHRGKFEDKFEYLKIAEIIVRRMYKNHDPRYYLFVDFDDEKIHSGLKPEFIKQCINEYMSQYQGQALASYLNSKDATGANVYTREQAYVAAKEDLYESYFPIEKVA